MSYIEATTPAGVTIKSELTGENPYILVKAGKDEQLFTRKSPEFWEIVETLKPEDRKLAEKYITKTPPYGGQNPSAPSILPLDILYLEKSGLTVEFYKNHINIENKQLDKGYTIPKKQLQKHYTKGIGVDVGKIFEEYTGLSEQLFYERLGNDRQILEDKINTYYHELLEEDTSKNIPPEWRTQNPTISQCS